MNCTFTTVLALAVLLGSPFAAFAQVRTDTYCPAPPFDDTCISRAIAAAPIGGEVYMTAGTYMINSPLTINNPVYLHGAGINGTILEGNVQDDIMKVNVNGTTFPGSFKIADFSIGFASDRSSGSGIHVGKIAFSSFSNIMISNAMGGRPYNGILIDNATQCFFNQMLLIGGRQNLVITTSGTQFVGDLWFSPDSRFDAALGDSIALSNWSQQATFGGIYFGHSSVWGSYGWGMSITVSNGANISNIFADGLILDSNLAGGLFVIGTGSVTNLKLSNVWMSSNGADPRLGRYVGAGPGIAFSPNIVQNWQVNGGMILANGGGGIIADGTMGQIQNVAIFDNNQYNGGQAGQYGIDVRGTVRSLTISGNRIYNTQLKTYKQNGLIIESGASNIDVNNNFLDTGGSTTRYLKQGTGIVRLLNNVTDSTH